MLFFYDSHAYYKCTTNKISFEVGGYYKLSSGKIVKCIQSTSSGFNFLDVNTNQVVFKHAFYPVKYAVKMSHDYSNRNIVHCNNRYRKIPYAMFTPLKIQAGNI